MDLTRVSNLLAEIVEDPDEINEAVRQIEDRLHTYRHFISDRREPTLAAAEGPGSPRKTASELRQTLDTLQRLTNSLLELTGSLDYETRAALVDAIKARGPEILRLNAERHVEDVLSSLKSLAEAATAAQASLPEARPGPRQDEDRIWLVSQIGMIYERVTGKPFSRTGKGKVIPIDVVGVVLTIAEPDEAFSYYRLENLIRLAMDRSRDWPSLKWDDEV
jgi:hypothetical protein